MNERIFVEKKVGFDVYSSSLKKALAYIGDFARIKQFLIYDVFNINKAELSLLTEQIIADVFTDIVHIGNNPARGLHFAIEYLPGQFDQRAEAAKQCFQLLSPNKDIVIRTGRLIALSDDAKPHLKEIKQYLINSVESREKNLAVLEIEPQSKPKAVPTIAGFIEQSNEEIEALIQALGLSMDLDDALLVQQYFISKGRNPNLAELKVLDTYWSDHCRHTTFLTHIEKVDFEGDFADVLKKAFEDYLEMRTSLQHSKDITLMDVATIGARYLKKKGLLPKVEESEEINACSVEVSIEHNGKKEDWLLMFKNETHNHPTEIDPFGGASTCIGGAIRDPLSGRSYVYQAMRISGSADPREKLSDTLHGKLPQRKITQEAAHGFSSYGNQIGLANTHINEIYHPGYKAKRMEVGMVVGAAPKSHVRRESPQTGDVVILLGGETGRDGIGGATGSSKTTEKEERSELASEVQKGNAIVERKLQRLFRNPNFTRLVKKSNDFGAGGVSVAIGEIAPGLHIELDKVPTKYSGLNGLELALSESQERMAVLAEAKDVEKVEEEAQKENLCATVIARVTEEPEMRMTLNGKDIVRLDRTLLDSNGAKKKAKAVMGSCGKDNPFAAKTPFSKAAFLHALSELNTCSQKGLIQMFDHSIGKSTVLMPLGGKHQESPEDVSAQVLPVSGQSNDVSVAAWGYHPDVFCWSPFHGGVYAVLESITKLIAAGANLNNCYLSFQEYFEKLKQNPNKWGKPLSALLGALQAQSAFQKAAIGGKDSMSGSYEDIHVPPTLISFAVALSKKEAVIPATLQQPHSFLYGLILERDKDFLPVWEKLFEQHRFFETLHKQGKILSAKIVKDGGIASTLAQMAFGNGIGFELCCEQALDFAYGSIIFESKAEIDSPLLALLGQTRPSDFFEVNGEKIHLEEALESWKAPLENIFPSHIKVGGTVPEIVPVTKKVPYKGPSYGTPRVCIPVFEGTNCEYDSRRSFEREGASTSTPVFRNGSHSEIEESIQHLSREIDRSQIFLLPGGFSAADEPDGSGKFITAVLNSQQVYESLYRLWERGGLILGICNGFQALIKAGLLPFPFEGRRVATLGHNAIGRHMSTMVRVRVENHFSPWLASDKVGTIYTVPVSHGEGRFVAAPDVLDELHRNGQIATRYVGLDGQPSMDSAVNPNGSVWAIESISSPCGKIYGRMAHPERFEEGLLRNIPEAGYHNIFRNGVRYFR